MFRRCRLVSLCVTLSAIVTLSACATHTYDQQVVPFKLPMAYPNFTQAGGADIAAKAYNDPNEAAKAFDYDMRGSGILPVEIIFDNKGNHSLEIVPGQTFLVDTANNLWPILDANLAYDRIDKKTQMSNVLPQAAKGSVLGAAAGALLGAAVGIVTRTNVGNAAGTGAAVGAAIGGVAGGTKGAMDTDTQTKIREDLSKRSLENRPVRPGEVAYGFVFFPGEAAKAKELRLQVKEVDTGVRHALIMPF
ncbi:MAG TPA: hypothetical protein VKF36_16775 [Syntrophorhabdales bacterium]|nr:hypothetical protein [Syntrophorhabdales bacterium]